MKRKISLPIRYCIDVTIQPHLISSDNTYSDDEITYYLKVQMIKSDGGIVIPRIDKKDIGRQYTAATREQLIMALEFLTRPPWETLP